MLQFLYIFDNLENTLVFLYTDVTNKICVKPLLFCEMRERAEKETVFIFYSVYNGFKEKAACVLDININFESPECCDFDTASEMLVLGMS